MPGPTAAPLVLSLGVALLLAGVALGMTFTIVGAAVLVVGLGLWISNLVPGQGHVHMALAEPARPVSGAVGTVEQLLPGRPGHRLQLPIKVHPISAGVKGGILGGVAIIFPALLYGWLSGHGIWYPVNLLAGIVLPGLDKMSVPELQEFNATFLIAGLVIHIVFSVVFGLMYGVLLPMLGDIPNPLAWGGLLMPILWTGASFALMRLVNPALYQHVDWPSYIFAQFLFGVVAAMAVMRLHALGPAWAGLVGGIIGGIVMPLPATIWALITGHGIWYPANLLAGTIQPGVGAMPPAELEQFHAGLLAIALTIQVALSIGFGLVYGLLVPRLPAIPGPMSWGGLLMPLLWTGASFGLMGVVNKVLQERVDWPWFIVSQFIFGIVASIVVVRSEVIHLPPVGPGQPAQGEQPT
jgi:hypothetical protein